MYYDPLQLGFYKIFAVDGIGEANAYEDFIAKVNVNFRSHEANARLVAAAPELLEALKTLVTEIILSDVDMGYIDSHFMPHIEKARAAIAKATGGDAA